MANFFKDYPSSVESVPNLTPNQMALQNKAIGGAGQMIDQANQYKFDFAPIAEKQTADFYSNVVPSLAQRFTGAKGSSAFQGALGAAGAGLKRDLSALGAEYGLRNQEQSRGHLSNLLSAGLSPSYEHFYTPPQEGPAKQLLQTGGQIAGQLGAAAIQSGAMSSAIKSASGALGGAGATAAAAAGAPLMPIFGGLAGAALVAGGIYGLVKHIKNKRANKRDAKAQEQQFASFEQYRRSHPQEFGADFPSRRRGETLQQWGNRVIQYTRNKQMAQGITDPNQLLQV